MNVASDLVVDGAKVDGIHSHDAVEGSEGDEIEVGHYGHASRLTMGGSSELVNVAGAVSYIPPGQYGVDTKPSRVQKADINVHMFKKLRNSEFTGGKYTNVAGNIHYVGASESAPPSKGDLC